MRALLVLVLALSATGAHAKRAKKAPEPKVVRVPFGQPFEVGPVRYVVESVTRARQLWPTSFRAERSPAGAWFVMVWYVLEGMNENPVRVRPSFYLRDGRGRRYTVSSDVQYLLAVTGPAGHDVDTFDDVLQPGVRRSLVAGFLLPDDAVADVEHLRIYFPASGAADFIEVPVSVIRE